MALAFVRQDISIPDGTGRRSINGTAAFGRDVRVADVAVNGFVLDYTSSDHHINIVEIDTDVVNVRGDIVEFRVECQYADKDFNDPYRGSVSILVIADTHDDR